MNELLQAEGVKDYTKDELRKIAVSLVDQIVKLNIAVWQAKEIVKFAADEIEKRAIK